MAVRLVAFDLDGTLIRGPNALAVIGAALRRPEWEEQMEILHMRGAAPEEMRSRIGPWKAFSKDELRGRLVHARPRASTRPSSSCTTGT